jgi:osmotically-inducible protein OsmY
MMANEFNRYPRRSDRDRSYTRQQEQFEDSSWRDEDRRQMGEVRDREDDGQFGGSGQPYSRERGYGRSFETGLTAGQEGYSSGGYGPATYANRESRGFRSFTGSDFGGADFAGPQRHYGAGRSPATPYGAFGAGSYGEGTYGAAPRREYGYGEQSERGFFERAGDEVASWFGDAEAARRREQDHRGHGPAGYIRSDERIREDASDKLTEDWRVDARAIEVSVASGEVTLDGSVPSREQKRRAEDLVDSLSGVKHVQNNLRVSETSTWDRNNSGETTKS